MVQTKMFLFDSAYLGAGRLCLLHNIGKTFRHHLFERQFSNIMKQPGAVGKPGIHSRGYDFGYTLGTTGNSKGVKSKLLPDGSSVFAVERPEDFNRKKSVSNK